MAKSYHKLTVTKQSRKLLMDDCVNEFLRVHPEFKGMFLTHDFMLLKVIDYYLNN